MMIYQGAVQWYFRWQCNDKKAMILPFPKKYLAYKTFCYPCHIYLILKIVDWKWIQRFLCFGQLALHLGKFNLKHNQSNLNSLEKPEYPIFEILDGLNTIFMPKSVIWGTLMTQCWLIQSTSRTLHIFRQVGFFSLIKKSRRKIDKIMSQGLFINDVTALVSRSLWRQ